MRPVRRARAPAHPGSPQMNRRTDSAARPRTPGRAAAYAESRKRPGRGWTVATVSLCMIVRDEEAVLARCLDSVRGAVDEIIIVDTGSTDRTRQIAARYTGRVYDFAWIDDFSAARNFAFSKAAMEFSMWLDADDVLLPEDRAAFLALKETLPDDVDAVMMRYHTAFDEQGRPTFTFYRERLVRTAVPHRWQGRVHETLLHEGRGRTLYSAAAVTHRSHKTAYPDRNLRIYEKQIAAGEPLTPRDAFYYGRELYYHGAYARACAVLETYLAQGRGWAENDIEACKVLARCRSALGDAPGAMDALGRSLRYGLPRAEVCCEMGALWLQAGRCREAAFWYELALTLPRSDESGAFVSEDCYGYLPCIQLCVCYDRLGDHARAEAYNRRAGEYRPASPAYLHNLAYFESLARTQPAPQE